MAKQKSKKAQVAAQATRNANQKQARQSIGTYPASAPVTLGTNPGAANPFTQYRNGGQTNKRYALNAALVAYVKGCIAAKQPCTYSACIAHTKAKVGHYIGPFDIRAAVLAGQLACKQ